MIALQFALLSTNYLHFPLLKACLSFICFLSFVSSLPRYQYHYFETTLVLPPPPSPDKKLKLCIKFYFEKFLCLFFISKINSDWFRIYKKKLSKNGNFSIIFAVFFSFLPKKIFYEHEYFGSNIYFYIFFSCFFSDGR